MPRVRAITSWADKKVGDEFDLTEMEARILCAPDVPGGQKAEYVDRAMCAADPAPAPKQVEAPSTEKRRYMRRDLRAEN
jgi:hypothetical protein